MPPPCVYTHVYTFSTVYSHKLSIRRLEKFNKVPYVLFDMRVDTLELLEQEIYPVPVVFELEVVPLEVSELEQFSKIAPALVGQYPLANGGYLQGHPVKERLVPTFLVKMVLKAL
jgi:hypothetical protein